MGDKTGHLIAQSLGWNDGYLIANTLVCLKVEREARVVFLDDDTRGLLDCLGANATLEKKNGDSRGSAREEELGNGAVEIGAQTCYFR